MTTFPPDPLARAGHFGQQNPQLFGVATKQFRRLKTGTSLSDFDVGHKPLPASSCGHRFPLSGKDITFLLAGSGERGCGYLTRVTGYRLLPQRKTQRRPIIRSIMHPLRIRQANGLDPRQCFARPRRLRTVPILPLSDFHELFAGPKALRDRLARRIPRLSDIYGPLMKSALADSPHWTHAKLGPAVLRLSC